MNICAKIASVLALVMVFGCSSVEEEPVVVPDQLRYVPSDAVGIIRGTCRVCLEELDSAHVFRNLGLEKYAKADAVLAFCYTSSLSPVFILDAGIDSTVVGMAARTGVSILETEVRTVEGEEEVVTPRVIFTFSETTMAAIRRHLSMGTSILDAPGFHDAVAKVADGRHWAVIRNSEISKVLPSNFLGGVYNRRDMVRMMRNMCGWTCFRWLGKRECDVQTVNGESNACLANMFDALKPSQSMISGVLPEATEIAVDMPLDHKPFRKAYLTYLDATQRLNEYRNRLERITIESGENPVLWESSMGIKEVAMVAWDGKKVVLVRPSVKQMVEEAGRNPYQGYTSVLYGFPFALDDDSFCAWMEGWLVIGSENDVREFLDEERPEIFRWPARPLKIAVYTHGAMLSLTKESFRIEL